MEFTFPYLSRKSNGFPLFVNGPGGNALLGIDCSKMRFLMMTSGKINGSSRTNNKWIANLTTNPM
ncbi:hypothetical protein PSTT_16780 [Puccinia striiformis]|uniref:Uncharacterized protein n=1 Tax=Puccinia striiformis TaxID=27350 RepID=A0A2S4UBN2_9BASI|nr:hypothetical protein PSTT_16780 [Puccinia striiformis]